MNPLQIKQALMEVRDLRKNILEKQLFRGYSGRARALGGCIALLPAIMGPLLPVSPGHSQLFLMWGGVFLGAVVFNYGAVLAWMARNRNYRRSDNAVVFEMLPLWIAGAALTLALWRAGRFDLLYGCWMVLFGLGQSMARLRLPRRITWIGWWYIACGIVCLAFPDGLFMRPVIMGLVFFVGEFAAGFIMHTSHHGSGMTGFLKMKGETDE